jgi:hypothetical protein
MKCSMTLSKCYYSYSSPYIKLKPITFKIRNVPSRFSLKKKNHIYVISMWSIGISWGLCLSKLGMFFLQWDYLIGPSRKKFGISKIPKYRGIHSK